MRTQNVTKVSLILNVVLLVGIIYIYINKGDSETIQNSGLDFTSNFYYKAQELQSYANSIVNEKFYEKWSTESYSLSKNSFSKSTMAKIPKDCRPLKDKKSVHIEFGELTLDVKKGQLADIKGLKISRDAANKLLENVIAYDKALSNICIALSEVGKPKTDQEFKFILDLMDRQQKIVDSFTTFKTSVSNSKSEEDITKNVTDNQATIKEITKS